MCSSNMKGICKRPPSPPPKVTGFSRRELGPKSAFLTPVPAAVAFLAPHPHPTLSYDEALEAPLAQAQPLPGVVGTSAEGGEAGGSHLQNQHVARRPPRETPFYDSNSPFFSGASASCSVQ